MLKMTDTYNYGPYRPNPISSGYNGYNNSSSNTNSGFSSTVLGYGQLALSAFDTFNRVKIAKQQNALAREAFEFNKTDAMKNFNLKLEDYQRTLARRENINNNYDNMIKESGVRDTRSKDNKLSSYQTKEARYDTSKASGNSSQNANSKSASKRVVTTARKKTTNIKPLNKYRDVR